MGPAGLLRAVSRCPVPAAKATLAAVPRQARGRLPGVGERPLLLSQGGGARKHRPSRSVTLRLGVITPIQTPSSCGWESRSRVASSVDSKRVTWFGHVRGHCAPST